jgi:hypothetical protein
MTNEELQKQIAYIPENVVKEYSKYLKYTYPMGEAKSKGDWVRYWDLHKKMRKDCWSTPQRIAFRIGAIKRWVLGDKWKP